MAAFYRGSRVFHENTFRNAECVNITIIYYFVKDLHSSTARALRCEKRSKPQLLFYLIRAKERTSFYIIEQDRIFYRIMGKIENFKFNVEVSKHYPNYRKIKSTVRENPSSRNLDPISDEAEHTQNTVQVNEDCLDVEQEYYDINVRPSTDAGANIEEYFDIDIGTSSDAYAGADTSAEYSQFREI